jgi:hypothetical protein
MMKGLSIRAFSDFLFRIQVILIQPNLTCLARVGIRPYKRQALNRNPDHNYTRVPVE